MSYVDLTGVFQYKKLLPWSRLAQLAQNDAFDVFLAGTKHLFYMATPPIGYTKITGTDDHAIRIVSTTGGGTGGTANFSGTVTQAHSHTIDSHQHNEPVHSHAIRNTGVVSSSYTTDYGYIISGNVYIKTSTVVGTFFPNYALGKTINNTTTLSGSNTGGTTDSQLSNIQFAYADVIVASKDS
jgi:hypothetical protein